MQDVSCPPLGVVQRMATGGRAWTGPQSHGDPANTGSQTPSHTMRAPQADSGEESWGGAGRPWGCSPSLGAHPAPGAVVRAADSAAAREALPGGAHGPLVLQAVVHGEQARPAAGRARPRWGPLTSAPLGTEQRGVARPEHPGGLEAGAVRPGHRGLHPGRRHREGPPGPLGQLRELIGAGAGAATSHSLPQPLTSTPHSQDPLASYDFNDYDPDPQPRYSASDENR